MSIRIGVLSGRSVDEYVYELINEGIDLSYEEFVLDLAEEGLEEDSDEWQNRLDQYQSDESITLFGDWEKIDNKYVIDKNGEDGYSAEYNSGTNTICVEWSKHTTKCHPTSPCYVMADGSGPCGDLDSPGGDVTAYTLPEYLIRKETV